MRTEEIRELIDIVLDGIYIGSQADNAPIRKRAENALNTLVAQIRPDDLEWKVGDKVKFDKNIYEPTDPNWHCGVVVAVPKSPYPEGSGSVDDFQYTVRRPDGGDSLWWSPGDRLVPWDGERK